MDPWLEAPSVWPDVHTSLLVTLRSALGPLVRPRYYVRVEVRLYEAEIAMADAVGVADVGVQRYGAQTEADGRSQTGREGVAAPATAGATTTLLDVEIPLTAPVQERYLTVRSTETHDVVTVIELLSPANKRGGEGRRQYLEKRSRVAESRTNLVEIDLLRVGQPVPLWQDGAPLSSAALGTYRVVIARGYERPRAQLLAFGLRDRLPAVPIPLRPEDAEPDLDLGQALAAVYDQGSYDLELDYRRGPVPPLDPADAVWINALLREAGLR